MAQAHPSGRNQINLRCLTRHQNYEPDGNPFQDYTYVDGETVAGSIIGWNFGEGHLADERLMRCVQEQCHFEDGDVRAICVEAQPILGSTLHWRIVDAKRGVLAEGHAKLSDLAKRKPWDYGEI